MNVVPTCGMLHNWKLKYATTGVSDILLFTRLYMEPGRYNDNEQFYGKIRATLSTCPTTAEDRRLSNEASTINLWGKVVFIRKPSKISKIILSSRCSLPGLFPCL